MNLHIKTTALLAAIVFTVLATASLFWLQYQEDSLKHAIFKGIDGQAQVTAHGIESFIEDSLEDARAISITFPTQSLLLGELGEVRSYLKQMFETYEKFQNGIFLLDAKGRILMDYPFHPELRGVSLAFREYYQRTTRENRGVVSKPYRSKRTGLPVLTFTAPVHNKKGRIIGVLGCSINLLSEGALDGYRKLKFGNTGYLYIIGRDRVLVLHPEDKRAMTTIAEGQNKLLDAAFKGFSGAGETINSLGIPMLAAVRHIRNAEWIVAVQVTQQEAYASVAETRTRIVFISSIAILAVIVLGAVAVRRVSRPLQQLERVASQITTKLEDAGAKGTYELAPSALDGLKNIRSRDEIGKLASSFLHLATVLKDTLGSLQRSAEDWERTFNSVHDAVMTLDRYGRIVRINQTAEDWFRTSLHKAQDQYGYRVIFGTETPPEHWPDVASLVKYQSAVRWSQKLEKPVGVFEFAVAPITYEEETTGAVVVVSDITARVEQEKNIRKMAFYDSLTGLPNRLLLQDRLQVAIATAIRNKNKAGVMFIDLDHFKNINDLYGHDAGDEVLKQMAGRLAACLRKSDTLSRFGGDEFIVVLQEINHPDEIKVIAERILNAQKVPLIISGHELALSSSIGIALFPDDGQESEALFKNADTAMYRAKDRGRNNYQYFTQRNNDADISPRQG